MDTTTTQTPRRRDRRRMVLAILTGGIVLGIGAAATLAAWNDSEFATGDFGSGSFDLEGSTDGTSFSSSPEAPGKTLTFALDADALTPGDIVYAPFAVRLSPGTGYTGDVTLASTPGGAGLSDGLTYSLYEDATFGCSAEAPPTGTPILADQDAESAAAPVFELTAPGTPVNLCFVVTAGDDIPQGTTGSITWEFVAESGTAVP